MKWTAYSINEDARAKGLTRLQVDGIPEEFVYKSPDLDVGPFRYKGTLVLYVPFTDIRIQAENVDELIKEYNNQMQYVKRDIERSRGTDKSQSRNRQGMQRGTADTWSGRPNSTN